MLIENAVHTRQPNLPSVFLTEPEANLLSAPAVFPPDFEDQLRRDRIETSPLPSTFAFPLPPFKFPQSQKPYTLDPSVDRHAFHAKLLRNFSNRHSVFAQGNRMIVDCYTFHVHGGKVANASHESYHLSHLK